MRTNAAGLDLIKKFEGFRDTAYYCPAGVLTIGYGHTNAAGLPKVTPGMKITRDEGEAMLKSDLAKYEAAVLAAIKVPLTLNQFSACVSLCYNIGTGAFKKSSVARFCNASQFDKAADAFALWNKAGGKILPGLVRRRAAEAALFATSSAVVEEIRPVVDEPKGKSMTVSTTNIAAGATAVAGAAAAAKETVESGKAIFSGGNITILLAVVIVAAAAWIIWERYKKSRDWAV